MRCRELFLSLFLMGMVSIFSPLLRAQVGVSVSPPRVYYTLDPAESGTQRILVTNISKQHSMDLSITFGDWKYDDYGNNIMLPPDTLENSCVSWLSVVNGTYLTLAPGESKEIELTMTVPFGINASENVQTAMLYVTQMNPVDGVDAKGAAIKINVRQGIKVYRRGAIPEKKQLEIVEMSYNKENNSVGLGFKNNGNVWTNGLLSATLFNSSTGKEMDLGKIDFYTMPSDYRKVIIHAAEPLEKGTYIATVILDYGDDSVLEAAELEFSYE